jgi:DNA-binding YbaB/EbfC family protein
MAKNFYARGGMGGMGGMNMQQAIKQAQKMQEDMQKMQQQMQQSEFEATAGGGAVIARVNGSHELLALEIKPEAVDPDDVEMLQDLVVAAVNAAFAKANETMEKQMKQITGGMNLPGGLF